MSELERLVELLGHLAAMAAFLSAAIYITVRRRVLRRTVGRALIVYWLVLLASLFFALINALRLTHLFIPVSPGEESGLALWLDITAEYLSLIAQGLIILVLISLKVMAEKSTRQRHILAIGAHPDDIEIACGATLAKMHDTGHLVRGLVLTRGERGGEGQVRPDEARSGADFLGLDQIQLLDFTDTQLQEQALHILAAIEAMMQDFKPDIIFTHSAHDQHQDHQVVHEATLRAARNQSTILCYESPSVTQEFVPTYFVDIGDYIEIKIESIKEHWDQRDKSYTKAERVRGTALFRGGQARTRYAEGFEVIRALSSAIGEI